MIIKDFLPKDWIELAEWFQNFSRVLPDFADKYAIPVAVLTATANDSRWLGYWVQAKCTSLQLEKQLTDYLNEICDGAADSQPPAEPLWEMPPKSPASVSPGLIKRVRQLANQIESSPNYTLADGKTLGIVGEREIKSSDNRLKPEFSKRTLPNFGIEMTFRKQTADAVRVEYQRYAAAWQMAAILSSSPGAFMIAPATPLEPEQIRLRCIYLKKNNPVGSYSDIRAALIAP